MTAFQKSQLTSYGLHRIAQAHNGERMLFTSIGLGDRALEGNLNEVTELIGEKQRFPISGYEVSGNNFWASCKPVGIDDPAGIYIRAIGLYIADPVHETERAYDKLYAVSSVIPEFGDGADFIAFIPRSSSNAEINYDIRLNTIISSTALIEIVGGIGSVGIATEDTLGFVRSSSKAGKVSVEPTTGEMTANISAIDIQQKLAQYHHSPIDARVRAQENVDIQTGGLLELDGKQLAEDDIVFLMVQDDRRENGVYLAHETAWTRAPGFDQNDGQAFDSLYIKILEGTDKDLLYTIKTNQYTIGTTELEFFETGLSSGRIPGKIAIRDKNGNLAGTGNGSGGGDGGDEGGDGGDGGGGEVDNRTPWEKFIDSFIIQYEVGQPFNPLFSTGPAHGQGSGAYYGGVLAPNGKVILIPHFVANVGIYDPVTDTFTVGPAHGQGTSAYIGGVLAPNGKIILIPRNAANIGVYDPINNTFTPGAAHGKGGVAFYGGVLALNGKVIMVPQNSSHIGIYDPMADTYTDGPAASGYCGAVLAPDGKVILVPNTTQNIGIYDPIINTLTQGVAHGKGGAFWGGVISSSGKVILVPQSSGSIVVYDPVSNTITADLAHGKGFQAYSAGVLAPNGKVIMIPHSSSNVGIYDPVTNTLTDGPAHGGSDSYGGVLAPNGKVILVPFSRANVSALLTGLERNLSLCTSPFINKY